MNSSVRKFNFDNYFFINILIDEVGECWFVANDIAKTLRYIDHRSAISTHCVGAKSLKDIKVVDSPTLNEINGLHLQTKLIPKSDVFRLIKNSTFSGAEKFQDWFYTEVLPLIEKSKSNSTDNQSLIEIRDLLLELNTKNELIQTRLTKIEKKLITLSYLIS